MITNNELFKKNMSFFKDTLPEFYQILNEIELKNTKIGNSKKGDLTLTYNISGNDYYIHSKYDPVKESMKISENLSLDNDHIVLFGLGLGYLLNNIILKKQPFARILIVEPDIEIIKQSLNTLNWETLLKNKDLFFVIGTDLNELANRVHDFINITFFDKIDWVELSSEVRLLKPFFDRAKEVINSEVKTNLLDFKTLLAENYLVPRNIIGNLPFILKGRATANLKDKFKDHPGIIVSAGPSLDKNISYLKQIRNRAVIISVDTALKPLISKNIQPHFTAIADPSYKNYLHMQGMKDKIENFIIAETGISKQIYSDFYKSIFTASIGKPLVKIIEENSCEFGSFDAWGSVISFAMNFAVYTGLNPIVFVGQDFAFSDMRNHCRRTSWEEKQLVYSSNIEALQRMEINSIGGNRKIIEVKDIYGESTFTSERLQLYKNYLIREISKRKDKEFINASEGGILTELKNMTLKEVIKNYIYGKKEINIDEIRAIKYMEEYINKKKLVSFFNSKIKFYKNYKNKIKAVIESLQNRKKISDNDLLDKLKRAEEVKNILYSVRQNGDIVEMWSRAPIFHLLKKLKTVEMNNKFLDKNYLEESAKVYEEYFNSLEPVIIDIIDNFKSALKNIKDGKL